MMAVLANNHGGIRLPRAATTAQGFTMTLVRLLSRQARLAAMVFAVVCPQVAQGQPSTRRMPPPEPVKRTLTTKDGVQLAITYYASTAGRQATPIIMLHDFNETRAVFNGLAEELQNPPTARRGDKNAVQPRAVVTVDLRGHGGSKTKFGPDGVAVELDANRFQTADFVDMVRYDLEAVRQFLIAENDAGKLNLNKLGVVGSGMGANVALLWAARDWATPPLAARKQGQDVKALALISPRWNFRGLELRGAMKFPPIQQRLSILLAYGADDRNFSKDGEILDKTFSRYHVEPPPDRVLERKDYFLLTPATNLQGTELLTKHGLESAIAEFFEARLGRKDFPYVPRKN
jgi:pimeloyl-ACP methyl ester carboxylesterase